MKILAAAFVFLGVLVIPLKGQSEVVGAPEQIIIPHVEFVDTPLQDAVNFLVKQCEELDKGQDRKGVNVVLVDDFSAQTVTMTLKNVPASVAFSTLAELSGARLENRGEYWTISRNRVGSVVLGLKNSEALQMKLNAIRLPSVEFVHTPLTDALNYLRFRSEELDLATPVESRGVNLVLKDAAPESVSVRLSNVSLATALEVTALVSGHRMEIREHLVMFKPEE